MSSNHDLQLPGQGSIRPRRVDLASFIPGSQRGSVLAYLGIPFAQPPVKDLRWKVPQGPLPTWPDVRASKWASDPFQDFASMEGMYKGRKSAKTQIERSEDCLYLNVWVPLSSTSTARPVLCWIYGGAFSVGNCSRPLHDGARLAHESGCIVVSLTYRVGPFGFLGSRALAEEDAGDWPLITREAFQGRPTDETAKNPVGAGNWGLWDLVTGLLWIQHSISHFGGDSKNVTVFGESAGSIAIHYLLLSKVVPEGLFEKAIMQSGVVATLVPRSAPSQQTLFEYMIKHLCPDMCDQGEKAQVAHLRKHVSAPQIADLLRPLVGKRPRSEYTPMLGDVERFPAAREDLQAGQELGVTDQWGPVWDGVFVDKDFLDRCLEPLPLKKHLRNGRSGLIIGLCADEGTMFNLFIATVQALSDHQKLFHPQLSLELQRTYKFDTDTSKTLTANRSQKAVMNHQAFSTCALYTGDAQFIAPILDYIHQQSVSGRDSIDVYAYLLAHRPSQQMLDSLTVAPEMAAEWGTFHTLDIPFVFGLDDPSVAIHPWVSSASEYGLDPDSEAHFDDLSSSARVGLSAKERQLSHTMMQTWSSFAHGSTRGSVKVNEGLQWNPVSASTYRGSIDDLSILTFGMQPQTPASSVPDTDQDTIPVAQMSLSEHPFSRCPPIEGTTLEERINFWMSEALSVDMAAPRNTTRYLQNYYGHLRSRPEFAAW